MGVRSWIGKRLGLTEATIPGAEGFPGLGVDPDDHLFRRLSETRRELPPVVQERALKLAWQMFDTNPLAHGIIEAMKDHVVGEGFSYETEDEAIMEVLDRHWKDFQNSWDIKQHERVRELSLFGEQMYITFVAEGTGNVRLASVDPINIRRIVVNPENPEEQIAVIVNGKHAISSAKHLQSDRVYRIIHEEEDPEEEATFGKLVGAKEDETLALLGTDPKNAIAYDGSCLFFAINKVSGATRGRSDLLSSLDWLDVYDQVQMNAVDRTLLINAFIWDVTLEGATPQKIEEWLKKHGTSPNPASVRVHGEQENWAAISPEMHHEDTEVQNKSLKAQILSASGLPPHWFGEQDANRATAVEMGSPTLKRLASRQKFVTYMVDFIFRFQIDQARIAGALPEAGADEKKYNYKILVPEMSSRDMSRAAQALQAAAAALTMLDTGGIIDKVEAQRIFAMISSQIGVDINVDEMAKRLAEQPEPVIDEDALEIAEEVLREAARQNGSG